MKLGSSSHYQICMLFISFSFLVSLAKTFYTRLNRSGDSEYRCQDLTQRESIGFFGFCFFLILFIYLFIYGCVGSSFLCRLSLVAVSGGDSSSRCAGLSLSRPLLLRSTGSRRAGSVIVAHGPSCSAACGIFPNQGSNPCSLHWQADSQPLHHQGSPKYSVLYY